MTKFKFRVNAKVITRRGSEVKIVGRYKISKFGNIYEIQYSDGYIYPSWLFEYLIVKQIGVLK